ncbi:MAG: cyclopropane-fatty-acyl-phospholipid synthase [Chloroflexia bacterium]|jgi:cyclopropane-fatty-acyl-phospholipid synthase|nr:cyclopropane-fatty-acyl-phospholipid synthase [Chloroflexia bacterium]
MTSSNNQERPHSTSSSELYQSYTTEEDKQRINVHYEQPSDFFLLITGGKWNTYSCNLWSEGITTDTESQEAKLDLLAQLMELKPGQRILDVGCGWAGPLVYLCKKYGVRGVGVTTSPTQKRTAEERIARYGVDAQIVLCHWRDFQDEEGFDAVYTDEVIVHFNDLGQYFIKVYDLLHAGGRMLNKELHLPHHKFTQLSRAGAFVHEIYGNTGNYRTLAEELTLAGEAGFEVRGVHQIPLWHYERTSEHWIANMQQNKKELVALVGPEHYRRFLTYLKITRQGHGRKMFTLDTVVCHK